MSEVSVFLIGKTGHGKSSTGNSLLGREAFVVSDFAESETSDVQVGTVSRNGTSLRVVDGPGLGDTRMDTVHAIKKACSDIGSGIAQCPNGVQAFILVLKYGNRFTEEEQRTVESLKTILGANVLRDHGVIVFTHGESFDMMAKRTGASFPVWCGQQTGTLATYLAECGNRCVLFYNLDPDKMAAPVEELTRHVTDLRQRNGGYSHATFLSMHHQHNQMVVRASAPQIRQKIESDTGNLRQRLISIQNSSDGFDSKLSQLASLGGQVRQLRERTVGEDLGTGVLITQQQSLDALQADVSNQERTVANNKAAEENRKREEQLRAERERIEEERRRAREDSGGCAIL